MMYYLIALAAIVLINFLIVPSIQERTVEQTDYTSFLKDVDAGKVNKAEIQSEYI